jgi:predicted DNA binding CopG/RHH family protein
MKKEYDFRKMKKRESTRVLSAEAAKVPISIRLDGGELSEIREEADRMGIPYQTLIGSILHRYVTGELVDRAAPDLKRLLKKSQD